MSDPVQTLREQLSILADSESWDGDPLKLGAALYGHDTPFEIATRLLPLLDAFGDARAAEGREAMLRDASVEYAELAALAARRYCGHCDLVWESERCTCGFPMTLVRALAATAVLGKDGSA